MNPSRVIMPSVLAAVLAISAVADAPAQRLGRLFTTAEERAHLDELRRQAGIEQPQPEPQVVAEAPVPVADTAQPVEPGISRLVINGVVRRSRGPATVWVNGELVERGSRSRDGVSVESARTRAGGVRLRLPSGAGTVALRPGQQIDIDSGALLEAWENRADARGGNAFLPSPPPARTAPAATPVPVPAPAPSPETGAAAASPPADTVSRVMESMVAPEAARSDSERAAIEALRERVQQAAKGASPPVQR